MRSVAICAVRLHLPIMSADVGRAAALEGVVGSELHAVVCNAKVLVVGAGGIGCELLKNLAMCGFGEVELVSFGMHMRQ